MFIETNTLDQPEFWKALSYLNNHKEEKHKKYLDLINNILVSSNGIVDFLVKIDCIADEDIQSSCRCAALAQMYGVKADYYYSDGAYSRNCISYCKNNIAVIDVPASHGCVILTKYGEILVDEGELWLNAGNFDGPYCHVRKLIDGHVSFKTAALYSNDGEFVVPFGIFDTILLYNQYAEFKYLKFEFRLSGKISEISTEMLNFYMEDLDSGSFFISPVKMVFQLRFSGISSEGLHRYMQEHSISPNDMKLKLSSSMRYISELSKSEDPVVSEFIQNISQYRLTKDIIKNELNQR